MLLLAAALAATLGIPADLDRILAAPTLHGAHVGALVIPAAGGPAIYERGADSTVQPASTMKLLVGSAALERLGPAYRFTTTVTRGDGDTLILHGGGDPLLRAADLDAAADAVAHAGIMRAQLVLDESHVAPDERRAPGWSVDDILAYYAPVVNGLPFEENVLAVTLAPGAAIGLPPAIQLPAPFAPLAVPAGTCNPGPTLLTFTMAAHTVAQGYPDTSDVTAGPCGDIVVTGEVPLGAPSHVDAAVELPEALALGTFAAALAKRGIAVVPSQPVAGPVAGVIAAPFTPAPSGPVVWRHDSEPLSAMLADMWLPSDNLIAEELLRELDVNANARAGSLEGGTALERLWLRSIGVDPASVTLVDGSGPLAVQPLHAARAGRHPRPRLARTEPGNGARGIAPCGCPRRSARCDARYPG